MPIEDAHLIYKDIVQVTVSDRQIRYFLNRNLTEAEKRFIKDEFLRMKHYFLENI